MTGSTKTRDRRPLWQYSLRTLFVLVTVAVGLLVAWRVYVEPFHQQRETMVVIEKLGGSYKTEAAEKWMRRLYGDGFQNIVLVDLADCDNPDAYLKHVVSLPRLQTLVVGGRNFSDEHLRQLDGMESLRGLVLDSTGVNDDALDRLKRSLPNLVVARSQRRIIEAIESLGGRGDCYDGYGPLLYRRAPHQLSLAGRKYFREIARVILTGEKVGDADLEHLGRLPQLRTLYLEGTQVSDAGLAHLKKLTKLKRLYLTGTRISDEGLAHLRNLTRLEELSLARTQVSDAGLVHLRRMTRMQMLELQSTQVGDAGLVNLKAMTQLVEIFLSKGQDTDPGIKAFRNAMPNVNLHGVRASSP